MTDAPFQALARLLRLRQGPQREAARLVLAVGHTPVERFASLGNVHYIDTAAWKGGNANPALFPLLDAHTLRPAEPPSALRW